METRTEFTLLSDGSKVWSVIIPGMQDIILSCVSQDAAYKLAEVFKQAVCDVEVREVAV